MALHYGRDDFKDQDKLVRTLSRERAKDMATDYAKADPARSFAERRGITFRERVAEIVRQAPEKARGMFDGLRLAIGGQDRGAPAAPERQRGHFADFQPPPPAPIGRTAVTGKWMPFGVNPGVAVVFKKKQQRIK